MMEDNNSPSRNCTNYRTTAKVVPKATSWLCYTICSGCQSSGTAVTDQVQYGNDDFQNPQLTAKEPNYTTANSILHAAYICQLLHCSSMAD